MTWALEAYDATDAVRYAADLPMVLAGNVARSQVQPPQWRTTGRLDTGTDATEPGYPTACANDWEHGTFTRANVRTGQIGQLVFELADVTFDAALVLGHNAARLGAVTGGPLVQLRIADDAAFDVRPSIIASWDASAFGRRLVNLNLGRYTGVRHLRLEFFYSGDGYFPEVGELLLLRRRTLHARPDVPWDEHQSESRVSTFSADAGEDYPHARYAGRRVLDASWPADSADVHATFRGLFVDTRHGVDPWVWVPRPLTDPAAAHVMRFSASTIARLELPQIENPARRVARLSAIEQSPFVESEAA